MGKWASRWLGDNFSEVKFMQLSVSGVMLMNMFGIPLVGADICGFLGNTNENLCAKWHFVGAFYPFSRNHNGGQLAQEPYIWSQPAQAMMRDAIRLKYSLIRYYYTSLFDLSTKGTGTFYKPLFFEFPEDFKATQDINNNVMLGSALKLSLNSTALNETATSTYYFPAGTWCRLAGNTKGENCFVSKGQNRVFHSNISDYQVHLREGFIVPMQNTSDANFHTTGDLQQRPVDLHVLGSMSGNASWTAQGRYVNDDGETLDLVSNFNSYTFYATATGQSVRFLVGMDEKAYNKGVQPDGCIAVNKNDYLSSLKLYNAKALNLTGSFNATIQLRPDGHIESYAVVHHTKTDSLLLKFQAGAEICLSRIMSISIRSTAGAPDSETVVQNAKKEQI